MVPNRLSSEVALLLIVSVISVVSVAAVAGCGWLPSDTPAKPPVVVDQDIAQTVHVWKIAEHVLSSTTTMSEPDAAELHGRTVQIAVSAYASPWHGSCDDAGRQKRERVLADVTAEADVSAGGRAVAVKFGIAESLTEYTFSCVGTTRIPPLTMYISGARAMTCFAGVCYLLLR